jgi:acyl carrier protein
MEQVRTKVEIRSWIVRHLAEELRVAEESVAATGSFVRLSLDSLQVLDSTLQLEEFLHHHVPLDLLYDHRTVDALAEALAELVQRESELSHAVFAG